ncbi:hypothetical protein LTR95_009351 [Oleoguttula sp. CCFEE 5521]
MDVAHEVPQVDDEAFHGYRPLDKARREIRLLDLQAGHGEDIVRCQITHAFLDDATLPSYETISYVWGDPSIRTFVEIDGCPVAIPRSAAAALARMRLRDANRMLWIDAVCIDQANSQERGHQVGMMADVYAKGVCCLAYLGSDFSHRGDSAALAVHILREYALTEMSVAELSGSRFGSKNSQLGPLIVECAEDAIDALCGVLTDPWLRRLWVLQEATLSTCTVLHLEGATIELSHLLQVYKYLVLDRYREIGEYKSITAAPHALSLGYMAWLQSKASAKPVSLQNLLIIGSYYEVADDRDRVYAVLGIFQRGRGVAALPQCLDPDYHKSSHEVLREATYCAVNDTQRLQLWHAQHCEPDDPPTNEMPSWVPLLRSAYSEEERPMELTFPTHTEGADGGRLRPQDHLVREGMALGVEGFVLDTVCARTTLLEFNDFDFEGLQFLQDAVKLFSGRAHTLKLDLQDLEQTLVAGEQEPAYGERPLDALMDRLSSRKETTMPGFPAGTASHVTWPSRDDIFARDLRWFCTHRCFFITQAGYIGLGPEYLQEGDIVTILSGGDWPFALRRCDLEKEQYQFLSSCYVHGVMHGEAAESHDKQGLPWRSFDIV